MEKHEVTFLAAAILMSSDGNHKDILNSDGQKSFNKSFTIYQELLEKLYDKSIRKNL